MRTASTPWAPLIALLWLAACQQASAPPAPPAAPLAAPTAAVAPAPSAVPPASAVAPGPGAVAPSAVPPGPASVGLPPGMALPAGREVRPVYPEKLTGAPDPLVQRYCDALHRLPETRRAACCNTQPGTQLGAECVRTLHAAVKDGAIQLHADEVNLCAAEFGKVVAGCDWVGAFPPTLPAVCQTALHGTRKEGQACRSSLECTSSLRCRGAGPTQVGVCAPPLERGARCGLAVDTLASYTRQDQVDLTHPECAGFCDRLHQCAGPLPQGAPCLFSAMCGPEARCGKGRCVRGDLGTLGASCSGGDCAAGLRCNGGVCIQPGAQGARCTSDFECRGGCKLAADPKTGAKPGAQTGPKTGTCAPRCDLR